MPIEFFDIPNSDATVAWAINARGDVVGTTVSGGNVFHGYQRDRNGNVTPVDVAIAGAAVANCTSARGIGSSGEIVGFVQTLTCGGAQPEMRPGAHGFVRSRDGIPEIVDVPFPGIQGSVIFGTNPAGDLVGAYLDADNRTHGFLRQGGATTQIDVNDATQTTCRGINANGEIVGRFDTHGYVRSTDGTIETIDFPGATSTVVGAINPRGDIVGRFATPGVVHAFLRRKGGQLVELVVVPGATSTDATGISPSGDIVGSVTFTEGGTTRTRGFIQRA